MLGEYQRWAGSSIAGDFALAESTASALAAGVYSLVFGTLFGWPGFIAYLSDLLLVVAILCPIGILVAVTSITPRKVGANDEGFAFVRFLGRGRDVETFLWDALVPGPRSKWVPFIGRKYPVTILHAAGLPDSHLFLSRAQAELLASFPRGAAVHRMFD